MPKETRGQRAFVIIALLGLSLILLYIGYSVYSSVDIYNKFNNATCEQKTLVGYSDVITGGNTATFVFDSDHNTYKYYSLGVNYNMWKIKNISPSGDTYSVKTYNGYIDFCEG